MLSRASGTLIVWPMQHPIPSGYSAKTTARYVIGDTRLDGKTAVVTGGYSGIGLETTRTLASAGAHVVVPARSRDKASAALADIKNVTIEALDLADPKTIDAFAERMRGRTIDLLINNAGIMACPLERDARGYELQFATNHLGHFQLTLRLAPMLGKDARVMNLSSGAHRRGAVDFDDPFFERRPYDKWVAYSQAKTAIVLFSVGLNARGIKSFAVHPGVVLTDLSRSISDDEMQAIIARVQDNMKTTEQGAATTVWCAVSPQLEDRGGVYCENCDIAPVNATDAAYGVQPYAIDPQLADRLWSASEVWTNVKL